MPRTKLGSVGDHGNARPPIAYSGWMVMGAAVFGVLLGAGALWFGRPSRPVLPPLEQTPPAAVPGQAEARPSPGVENPSASLVDAVARTRGSVVCLKAGDQIQGAGVVHDSAGTVLTNYHVVESMLRPLPLTSEDDGNLLIVRFANGRELPARVVITSPEEDIAMLRLQPADSAETFASSPAGRSCHTRCRAGSSRPSNAPTCFRIPDYPSFSSTHRSTWATREDRCSTSLARLSGSPRRARARGRGSVLRSRSTGSTRCCEPWSAANPVGCPRSNSRWCPAWIRPTVSPHWATPLES
ncbi:MAG: hypothetical protein B7733_09105 [Myxococcales bacterium FL481]|nr:MAG: hypothetical protein B7733_09105 [Myxococcales bacterium FL481]